MPKFKQPKLPRAVNVTQQRAVVDAALLDIRAARQKYKADLARAAVGLHGKAFVRFVYLGTQAMRRAGMYSDGYNDSDLLFCAIKAVYHSDMAGKETRDSWSWWRRDRGRRIRRCCCRGVAARRSRGLPRHHIPAHRHGIQPEHCDARARADQRQQGRAPGMESRQAEKGRPRPLTKLNFPRFTPKEEEAESCNS